MDRPLPETPAQLYDLLQELFGVGTYDDIASRQPWFRARMTEIARLKAMLRKRRVTVEDVAIAAWFAHDRGIPIPATWRLFGLIAEAKRSARERDRQAAAMEREDRRTAAVVEAFNADEHTWAARLINTSDRDLDAVIDQWRSRSR